MVRFVNAKINLGLDVVRRRPDGYHELSSVFFPIGLHNGSPENPEPFNDILEVHLRGNGREDEFVFSGRKVACRPDENIVVKAVSLFRSALADRGSFLPAVSLRLDKHIPDGAGLGGGSADASFTLRSLNDLAGSPFSTSELLAMAKSLGADCPFFIINSPALASGIGEVLTPVRVNLDGCWILVVKPDVYVSTREAFAGIVPALPSRHISSIISLPVADWAAAGLKNDFEPHIFRLHPEFAELKTFLYSSGALYASMSGSGSSIFGIFPSRSAVVDAASAVSSRFPDALPFIIKP